jgi:hypothetical protein
VRLVNNHRKQHGNTPDNERKTLYQLISKTLDEVTIRNISVNDGHFKYLTTNGKDTLVYVLKGVNFHAEYFSVDSISEKSREVLYSKNFSFRIENMNHLLPGKAYTLNVDNISMSVKDSSLVINKLTLIPKYDKNDFAYKVEGGGDWMTTTVEDMQCSGLNFHTLWNNGILEMNRLILKNMDFENFRNKKTDTVLYEKPMLYELLQKATLKMNIKNILVENARATYEELPLNGKTPGVLYFDGINAQFHNFTNIVRVPDEYVTLKATGKLMGQGKVNTTFQFPFDAKNDAFEFSGAVESMDLTALNPVIVPLIDVKITGGTVSGMTFNMRGNSQSATVDMQVLYNDLQIKVFHEKHDQLVEWGLISTAANLRIKSDNPEKGKSPRDVTVSHERDPNKSMLHYIWKTIQGGLLETAGITKKEQDKFLKLQNRGGGK